MWLWKIEEEKIKLAKAKGLIPVRCYLPEWEKDIVVLFHDIAKSSVAYTAEIINVAISKVKRKHREHTEYLVTLNEFREIKPSFRMKDLKVSKEDYLSQKYRLPHRIAKEDEEIIRNKYPNLWTKTSKGRTLDYFKKNYLPQDLVFSNTVTVSSRFLPNNSPSSSPKTNSKPAAASSKGRGKRNSRKVKYFEEDEEEEEDEDEEYNVEQDDDFYEEKVDKYADSPKKEESTGDQEEEIQEEDCEFEDDVEIEQNVEEEVDIPIVNINNNNNNGSRIGGKSIPHNLFNSNPSTSAFCNESYSFENHPHLIDPIIHEDSYLIKNNIDESLEHSFLENNSSTSSHHEGFVDEFFNFDLQAQANSVLEENIEMYDIASKKDIFIETKKTEKKEDESGEIINRKNTSSTATSATVNLQNLDSSANTSSSTFSPTSTNNMTIVNSPNSQMTELSDPKKKKFNGDQRKKRSSKSLEESEGEELQQQLKSKENSEKEEILPSSKKKRSPRSNGKNGLTLSQEEEKNSSSPTSSPTNSSASVNRKQNDSLVININFYGLRDCFAKCFSIDISKFKNLEELEDAILRKCCQFDQNLSKLNSTIPKNQLMSSSLMNSKNPNLYAIFEYHDKVYKELTSIREGRVTMDNIRSFADYIDVYISSSPSNRKAVFR